MGRNLFHGWLVFLLPCTMLAPSDAVGQDLSPKIGVVLSGGGARGGAHIGFLQALEEQGIQAQCVVGSSVGGLVGAYYAVGYRPSEMKHLVQTEALARRVSGKSPLKFGFKEDQWNPKLVELRLSSRGDLIKGHLISSLSLDWGLMEELSPALANAHGDFDALWIPFRCVASDVLAKKDTVFDAGELAYAVRASITFPFYFEPLFSNGRPLYDGGLYNNFPSDVMLDAFDPDFILGCSVVSEEMEFDSDNLAAQLEAMISSPSNVEEVPGELLIVRPEMNVRTFDFDRIDEAIAAGYAATMERMPELLKVLTEKGWKINSDSAEWENSRQLYRLNLPKFSVGEVTVLGLLNSQKQYASSLLTGRLELGRTQALERNLHLLASDVHIGSIRPSAQFHEPTGLFDVEIDIRSERELVFEAGGNLSSRPVSFGYASGSYNWFGRVPFTAKFSTAFGSLYSAVRVHGRFDFHRAVPIAIQPYFLIHRFNYVRSFSTFFQDVRPSFMVASDTEWGAEVLFATGTQSVLKCHFSRLQTTDLTYPAWEFNPADTSDRSYFAGWVGGASWSQSTLDMRQFARSGSKYDLRIMRFNGSMSSDFMTLDPSIYQVLHEYEDQTWFRLAASIEHYWEAMDKRFSFGMSSQVRLSDEPLRSTYRSSLVFATPFEPMPGARSVFLENFRAFNYASAGSALDVTLVGSLRWRFEAHGFLPFEIIKETSKGPVLSSNREVRWMLGSWLVADSPVGLFSMGAEYYKEERTPWLIEFSWGYRIFQSALRR